MYFVWSCYLKMVKRRCYW